MFTDRRPGPSLLDRYRAGRDLRRAARSRSARPWPVWARVAAWLLGTLTLLLGVGAIGGLLLLDRAYSGRVIPNVAVQGMSLDGLRPDEARARLDQRYAAFLATPVTFQFADRAWRPTLAQLGIVVELDQAVDRAYTIGRGVDLFASASEALAVWQDGVDLPIRLTVDRRQLQTYLIARAREVEVAPENAQLSVLKGRVISSPERIGRQVLVDQTAQDVLAGLSTLAPQTVILRDRDLRPLVENTGIAETQRQLRGLLQGSVTLTAGEQSWTWTPEALGALVELTRSPRTDGQGQQVVATLDRRIIENRLRAMAATIDTAAVEPRLRRTSEGLQIVKSGLDGARLEIPQALDQLTAALWQDSRAIDLPVSVLQPQARPETLANLGIVELVAQGQSSFEKSAPYRVTNIQAGAAQMDGVLIAPGAEFSFDQTVGAIDESNGFTQGYAIIDGRTQLEWGGGVCQVSTTVFRAAFWAGVPIVERNQHSFRISWYEKFEPIGMDAAIFTGPEGYDLRFVNDTGAWLLMETDADTTNEVLTVYLYGTRPDREIIQTPPVITNEVPAPDTPRYINDPTLPAGTFRQTDTARGGMDVRVGRIVKQGGQVLYEDTFFSRFQSWPNIFVRGTGQ